MNLLVVLLVFVTVHAEVRLLDPSIPNWYGTNRERINEMLTQFSEGGSMYNASAPAVAIFDWDNTVIKNDIGDATFFYMVRNSKILQPPQRNWTLTSSYLTTDAVNKLSSTCDELAEPGQPLPTSTNTSCADTMVEVYNNAIKTGTSVVPSFLNATTPLHNRPYGWVAALCAGYTPSEINTFATLAFEENNNNAEGATQLVGTTNVTHWLRVYPQIKDLILAMTDNNFDVWVCSATSQQIVEAIAHEVGIPPSKVIGVRYMTDSTTGRLTYSLQGCGPYADGHDELITYNQGKRCWINKAIFGVQGTEQLNKFQGTRQVFGAGDSDTDVAFVQDATALKLAVNRGKTQLMCNAYANYDNTWLINPMFIRPAGCTGKVFKCSTAVDEASTRIVDESGQPFSRDFNDTSCEFPAGTTTTTTTTGTTSTTSEGVQLVVTVSILLIYLSVLMV